MLLEVGSLEQDRVSKKIEESALLINTDHVVLAIPGILNALDENEQKIQVGCWNIKLVTGDTFVINGLDLQFQERDGQG